MGVTGSQRGLTLTRHDHVPGGLWSTMARVLAETDEGAELEPDPKVVEQRMFPGWLFLLRDEDKAVGYAHARFASEPYTGAPIIQVSALYLEPEYRKGRNGLRLVRAVEALQDEHPDHRIYWSVPLAADKTIDFLAARGYRIRQVVMEG